MDFNLAVGCNIDCQTAKFNSPPKFPAIQYVCTINFDIVSSMLESYAGLRKKMEKLAKEKDCELIGEWRKSVINRLYWSAVSTPSGDGEEIKAKWLSLDNHIHNKNIVVTERFSPNVNMAGYQDEEGKNGLNHIINLLL